MEISGTKWVAKIATLHEKTKTTSKQVTIIWETTSNASSMISGG